MTGAEGTLQAVPTGGAGYEELWRRLEVVRDQVRAEALAARREDLAAVLDGIEQDRRDEPARVVVAGSVKRGKSTLLNTLVGRPLLSPVGADVTTSCWLEVGYGPERATALIADRDDPGTPVRRDITMQEIESYVSLTEVTDAVLGVEVRIPAPILRRLLLVDTPGVGGLDAGHSRTTLSALRRADALVYVCDARQPVLAPEVDFLEKARGQVATVLVAVAKSDTPGSEVVFRETAQRLHQRAVLADVPLFAVAAPLAERAQDVEDDALRERLVELSGIGPLVAELTERTLVGTRVLRLRNAARTTAGVAGALSGRARDLESGVRGRSDQEGDLRERAERLAGVLDDGRELSRLIAEHVSRLRTRPAATFEAALAGVRERYAGEAERGPGAQLSTLASRMTADVTAVGVTTLETAVGECAGVVGDLLAAIGAGDAVLAPGWHEASPLTLTLHGPAQEPSSSGLANAAGLFPTIVQLLGGSAVVVSVLTGPGAIAASLAVAACAGWWRARTGDEHKRRAQLRAWVDAAAAEAVVLFGREVARRADAVQAYVEQVLPGILRARRAELDRLHGELARLRAGDEHERRSVAAGLAGRAGRLDQLAREASDLDDLVARC